MLTLLQSWSPDLAELANYLRREEEHLNCVVPGGREVGEGGGHFTRGSFTGAFAIRKRREGSKPQIEVECF